MIIRTLFLLLCLVFVDTSLSAKTVVFWQDGFPTVGSEAVAQRTLKSSLSDADVSFVDLAALTSPQTLAGLDLLVLPYGSAFPVEGWHAISQYLHQGGNMLVLGGQPFRSPVVRNDGKFVAQTPQDTYSREVGILHTYVAPQQGELKFGWKDGYNFFPPVTVKAKETFVLEGRLNGLGYLLDGNGERMSAPVVYEDHLKPGAPEYGSRFVFADLHPEPGYWDSPDGEKLISLLARYARSGAAKLSIDTQYAAVRPGEAPHFNVRWEGRAAGKHVPVHVRLIGDNGSVLETRDVQWTDSSLAGNVEFNRPLKAGFYKVEGSYSDVDRSGEAYQTGFWVNDEKALSSGPAFGRQGDFLTRNGQPFFPVGTNYFSTEENGWDFSGARNAAVWEHDFAAMQQHGITFVRTGVWNGHSKIIESDSGGVSERFLRNLEAYLLSAQRHNIIVNFTFFAFDPQTTLRLGGERSVTTFPGTNPYLDPVTVTAEQRYLLSIVNRFKSVPNLSWDLINEPSFSNPNRLWKGNTPNGDAAEMKAWHQWLQQRYGNLAALAAAWSVTPEHLVSFDTIPLPKAEDLMLTRYGKRDGVRAFDYNRFAQDAFSGWVSEMAKAIATTGSKQLVNVGQDEGGVTNRVLNQFYGGAGVAFTTNHTYWQDDALLWDSLASKRPGVPNIVGETGYQPVWRPAGDWRNDEMTGVNLQERKWALGFAGGTSGAVQWDWAREADFGMERSDGSSKIWEERLAQIGAFAEKVAPFATQLIQPDTAIVLPQSLQLSVFGPEAIQAQQSSVRALYGYARSAAYVVGEYQLNLLGNPKLIIVPSPWTFEESAWKILCQHVQQGATLLLSGRFDADPHFLATDRARDLGIDYQPSLLTLREQRVQWPGGGGILQFGGMKTTYLEQGSLADRSTFQQHALGKGQILYFPQPLEMNDNLSAISAIYRFATTTAKADSPYSTTLNDAGIMICPTQFPKATLYAVTSESNQTAVSLHDRRSGKDFAGILASGRASLLLIGVDGQLIASYNWNPKTTS